MIQLSVVTYHSTVWVNRRHLIRRTLLAIWYVVIAIEFPREPHRKLCVILRIRSRDKLHTAGQCDSRIVDTSCTFNSRLMALALVVVGMEVVACWPLALIVRPNLIKRLLRFWPWLWPTMLNAIITTDQALQWNQTRANINAIIAGGHMTSYASWYCSHKTGKIEYEPLPWY